MPGVRVRYIVDDVDAAVDFYVGRLGFELAARPAPGFAIVSHGELALNLSGVGGGGGGAQPMPDGRVPEPGGWNRIQLQVEDLDGEVERLQAAGVGLRSPIIEGRGGRQAIVDDPSGNPVELFSGR
jgi:catechol 2,3-dioxygenase-like lactoylglutathione lyase family enzyme